MSQRSWLKDIATSIRFVSLLFGAALILLSLVLMLSILETRAESDSVQFLLFYELIIALSILAGGVTLVHNIARRVRIRVPSGPFFRLPKIRWHSGHGYGFTTALAIGLGATLGSPLFILIPLNVLQYGVISIASLILAAAISFSIARLYARMFREWNEKGKDCTDGPSFTKNACGRVSLRYFIARFGMWIGNTALAAYSLIISANYARFGFFNTLRSLVSLGILENVVTGLIIALLVAWFLVNAFFEKRYARTIAATQIALTVMLCGILLFETALLAGTANRPIDSLLTPSSIDASGLIFALITNTAFLFLLFFGFQEIQALSSDLAPKSSVPGLAFLSRFKDMDRVRFAKYAMLGSVVIATIINIAYAVGVYIASPDPNSVAQASIPAVYISRTMFGPWNGLLVAFAFIIASLTTFVPAYLASSRHLQWLSSDGFFPRVVGKSAWLFSLLFIVVLSLFNAGFLVRIIDFGVLVALAFVSFSAVWSRRPSFWPPVRRDLLPMLTGMSCLAGAGALYFLDPSVVLFGIILILTGYLIFDIFELGSYGSQFFLAVLYVVLFGVTSILARSGTFTESLPARVSIRLIQNTLQAATVVLGINLVLGTRLHDRLGLPVKHAIFAVRAFPVSAFTRLQRFRRRSELDRAVDRWMKLMSESERIAARDPQNFELVKRHLEHQLAQLRKDETL